MALSNIAIAWRCEAHTTEVPDRRLLNGATVALLESVAAAAHGGAFGA